jgi:hypothetical protein
VTPGGSGSCKAVPNIHVLVSKRPRYSVQIDGAVHYCQNVNTVALLLAQNDRVLSVNDVYNALDIAPHSKYRLLERLNGAIIKKIQKKESMVPSLYYSK